MLGKGSQKTLTDDLSVLFGVALALASTGAMVFTLQDLVTGLLAKSLASLAGMALQGCLYLFARSDQHRVWVFSWVLLLLSVLMSSWFMESTWQQQQSFNRKETQQQVNNNYQVEQQQQQIADLNQQITLMLASADTDTRSGYRDRALKTLAAVETLKIQRQQLLASLGNIQEQGRAVELSLFEQYDTLRITLWMLIALVIDVAAILALQPVTRSVDERSGQSGLTAGQPGQAVNDDPKYTAVVTAIRQGNVPPSKNQVRKQLNIGATKVADYFQRMKEEGVLFQDDKGWYQLAS